MYNAFQLYGDKQFSKDLDDKQMEVEKVVQIGRNTLRFKCYKVIDSFFKGKESHHLVESDF